ncbi:disintegrin and metalloproteinase domain-containing protein 11-like isoform X3 [Scleropages formosus]|uniref:disintegrin and metalloproteinase domain-containing protein 11-like isoform X3 n=1 Tax=Scleropages formosus TaxID=113540 RepID=UPI0010FAAB25|nr:disintegrin and metalloproteinase domain-containing protein 11-like isoform X3 [Scleropages formosus]
MLALRCLLFAAVTGWSGSLLPLLRDAAPTAVPRHVCRPQRLVQQSHAQEETVHGELDTRVRNRTEGSQSQAVHLAQSSFLLEAFGSSFILDLQLNHDLLSSDYVERHFDEDGRPAQTEGGEHCYYHGQLRDVPASWAALSTCHGLYGMFSDGKFTYGIEPVLHGSGQVSRDGPEQNHHVVYRMPALELPPFCPGCTEHSSNGHLDAGSDSDGDGSSEMEQPTFSEGLRRSKRQVRRAPPTVQTETKYIELMVVNDHDLFTQLRKSTTQTKNFAKAVVNMADAIYKEQLNTRIVLVAMETWSSQNMVSVGDDPLVTLRDFMKYRKESIKEHSDATHLLSGRTFQSSRSGTAYIGGVCSLARGGGVNEYGNVGPMAITLCQSLGQNIGMMWNKDRAAAGDCRCPDPWLGCIMEDTGYYLPRKFARCSIDEYVRFLQQGGGSCLFNKPSKVSAGAVRSGSGIVPGPRARLAYRPRSHVADALVQRDPAPRSPGKSPPHTETREAAELNMCVLFSVPPYDDAQLLDPPECGNGFAETGEECDCGSQVECSRSGGACCKKCTLTHDAMCSNGLCCRSCKYEQRGVVCREAVNDCDLPETCAGDSSQCPHNVHKLDGYLCENGQGRCYGGRCKTRHGQCRELWGHDAADRLCYEKLNTEGTEKGNCGRDAAGQSWVPCSKQDVLCGFLLCLNMTARPKFGELQGDVTSHTMYHQSKYLDCRGGHAVLEDGSDLGYVEDGTPCGPNMMCLERRCLPLSAFNLSSCPGSSGPSGPSGSGSRTCSYHGTCSNEVKCICERDYTGKDCSVYDPIPEPKPPEAPEKYKGPSGTNIIIGSIAGAILLAAIVLGGTGWGFKNIRRGRYDSAQQAML